MDIGEWILTYAWAALHLAYADDERDVANGSLAVFPRVRMNTGELKLALYEANWVYVK